EMPYAAALVEDQAGALVGLLTAVLDPAVALVEGLGAGVAAQHPQVRRGATLPAERVFNRGDERVTRAAAVHVGMRIYAPQLRIRRCLRVPRLSERRPADDAPTLLRDDGLARGTGAVALQDPPPALLALRDREVVEH